MKGLSLLLISSSLLSCCNSHEKQEEPVETKEIKMEEEISVYNLDPETYIPKEFGIFDFVNDDLEIIPLETSLDCIVSYPNPTHLVIEDEFILVGSNPPGMKPGELLLFSKDGEYRYKFGKGGRGPGEHVGWSARKVRYYPEDSTVMVYWGGRHSSLQLFDLSGEFKYQIDLPYPKAGTLETTVERWSDSTWFATGQDDWGCKPFGIVVPEDSIRFVLFSRTGDVIKEIRRTNFPALDKLQEHANARLPRPYYYNGTWKFNLRGNDTLFSIANEGLKPDAILATPASEFPLNIRVLRETDSILMLDILKTVVKGIKDLGGGSRFIDSDNERYFVLMDKSTKKTYSVKLVDDAFFIMDDFTMYDGRFMNVRFQWRNDRLSFMLSPLQWMELKEGMDMSKLRPTIREKLKVLDGLKEDDNLIVFTFTLKDEVDFE